MRRLELGYLLLEVLVYIALSSLLLTLLLQVGLNFYQQGTVCSHTVQQTCNLWAVADLLKRDLQQAQDWQKNGWRHQDDKLYRRTPQKWVCMAEGVQLFSLTALQPNLLELKLAVQSNDTAQGIRPLGIRPLGIRPLGIRPLSIRPLSIHRLIVGSWTTGV